MSWFATFIKSTTFAAKVSFCKKNTFERSRGIFRETYFWAFQKKSSIKKRFQTQKKTKVSLLLSFPKTRWRELSRCRCCCCCCLLCLKRIFESTESSNFESAAFVRVLLAAFYLSLHLKTSSPSLLKNSIYSVFSSWKVFSSFLQAIITMTHFLIRTWVILKHFDTLLLQANT